MTIQFQKYAGMSDTYSLFLHSPLKKQKEQILFLHGNRIRPRLTISCRFFMIDIDLGINLHISKVKVPMNSEALISDKN